MLDKKKLNIADKSLSFIEGSMVLESIGVSEVDLHNNRRGSQISPIY